MIYSYRVKIDKIIDADTIDVNIDLGFTVHVKERIRLARINAWEIRGAEKKKGLKAKKYVSWLLKRSDHIEIITRKKRGKYDRYIAEVNLMYRDDLINLNDKLVEKKYARYVKY